MSDRPIHTESPWRKFSDQVRGFIRSKVSSDQEAKDVVQDIFIHIHKGIGDLRHENRVGFGIARRALADYLGLSLSGGKVKGTAGTTEIG